MILLVCQGGSRGTPCWTEGPRQWRLSRSSPAAGGRGSGTVVTGQAGVKRQRLRILTCCSGAVFWRHMQLQRAGWGQGAKALGLGGPLLLLFLGPPVLAVCALLYRHRHCTCLGCSNVPPPSLLEGKRRWGLPDDPALSLGFAGALARVRHSWSEGVAAARRTAPQRGADQPWQVGRSQWRTVYRGPGGRAAVRQCPGRCSASPGGRVVWRRAGHLHMVDESWPVGGVASPVPSQRGSWACT